MECGCEEFKYTGKHEDPSGLYYFGARFYDPETGRFITEDPFHGYLTDPQSQNWYVYCRNNPLKFVDSDGYQFIPFGPGPVPLEGLGVLGGIFIQGMIGAFNLAGLALQQLYVYMNNFGYYSPPSPGVITSDQFVYVEVDPEQQLETSASTISQSKKERQELQRSWTDQQGRQHDLYRDTKGLPRKYVEWTDKYGNVWNEEHYHRPNGDIMIIRKKHDQYGNYLGGEEVVVDKYGKILHGPHPLKGGPPLERP